MKELTPAQRDLLPVIGLSTEPCDVETAKAAVSDAYRNAGLEPPKIWLHARCLEERRKRTARQKWGQRRFQLSDGALTAVAIIMGLAAMYLWVYGR